MTAKFFISLLLSISLAAGAMGSRVFAKDAPQKQPQCAGMPCVMGCCPDVACCLRAVQEQPRPARAPASPRSELQQAVLAARVVVAVSLPPPVERTFPIHGEFCGAHSRAPLSVSCIRLI